MVKHTHNNSGGIKVFVDGLFECVPPFCRVVAEKLRNLQQIHLIIIQRFSQDPCRPDVYDKEFYNNN